MTRGPILATIVRFGVPLGVANLAQQGYLLVDSVVVGRYLGVPGLAAVGAGQPLFTLLSAVFIGAATAFSVRLSHAKGSGAAPDRTVAGALAVFTVVWSVACLGLTLLLADPVLDLIGVHGPVAAESRRFLVVLAVGLPAVFGLGAVTAVQRGLGDSRSAMSVTILSSLLNVGLVWWFVGPLGLGIAGAAAATGMANLIGLAIALVQVRRIWHPAAGSGGLPALRRELRQTLHLGVPMGAQQLLIGLGVLALVWIVTPYGEVALAAVTVVARLELFTGLLFLNLSGALMAFVAQNRGADQDGRIREGVRQTLWLTAALTAVVSAGMLLERSAVAGAFGGDPATQDVIARYVVITYPFFVLYTVMVVTHGWLTGIGRPAVPLICTVVSFVLVRLPLSYVLGQNWGVDGILWAIVVGWVVGAGYTAVAVRHLPPAAGGPHLVHSLLTWRSR
jgi:putative MATE family efflux protein